MWTSKRKCTEYMSGDKKKVTLRCLLIPQGNLNDEPRGDHFSCSLVSPPPPKLSRRCWLSTLLPGENCYRSSCATLHTVSSASYLWGSSQGSTLIAIICGHSSACGPQQTQAAILHCCSSCAALALSSALDVREVEQVKWPLFYLASEGTLLSLTK